MTVLAETSNKHVLRRGYNGNIWFGRRPISTCSQSKLPESVINRQTDRTSQSEVFYLSLDWNKACTVSELSAGCFIVALINSHIGSSTLQQRTCIKALSIDKLGRTIRH